MTIDMRQRLTRRVVRAATATFIALAGPCHAAIDAAGLDETVAKAMAFWQVPGLAIAVVEDGEVALTRTYGVRDAEQGLPVTPETVFALGSLAKSLTATGLARLVDQGRIAWNGRVAAYVPNFRLMDEQATSALAVRHLMTHTSGLPRHDALWYLDAYTRPELVERLRYLAPFGPPGSDFAYSNLMVAVAGAVTERASGAPWDEFIRAEVLGPLGMASTRIRLADFLAVPERALGYFPAPARRVLQPIRDTDPVAPAAGFYADIRDATRYLLFHVAGGRPLLRPETGAALRTPSFVFRAGGNYELGAGAEPEIGFEAYGMGFYILDYRGVRTVRHTGVIDGYSAVLSFIPDRRAGIVVLTNLSGDNPVPTVIERAVYDRLLGLEPVPWFDRFAARTAGRRTAAQPPPPQPETHGPPPAPGRPVIAYAGVFRHPAYGDMAIEPGANGRALSGRLHKLAFALRPLGGDLFVVPDTVWPLREGLRVRFETDGPGEVVRLVTPLADGPTYRRQGGPLVFERVRE
jgi:CubicO group peptidase (beta-lactamase class C family)